VIHWLPRSAREKLVAEHPRLVLFCLIAWAFLVGFSLALFLR
jgi:hypothetical protein